MLVRRKPRDPAARLMAHHSSQRALKKEKEKMKEEAKQFEQAQKARALEAEQLQTRRKLEKMLKRDGRILQKVKQKVKMKRRDEEGRNDELVRRRRAVVFSDSELEESSRTNDQYSEEKNDSVRDDHPLFRTSTDPASFPSSPHHSVTPVGTISVNPPESFAQSRSLDPVQNQVQRPRPFIFNFRAPIYLQDNMSESDEEYDGVEAEEVEEEEEEEEEEAQEVLRKGKSNQSSRKPVKVRQGARKVNVQVAPRKKRQRTTNSKRQTATARKKSRKT